MMAAWISYTLGVALLLSGAAWIAEQALRARRLPARAIWLASLVLSLLLPVAMSTVEITMPPALGNLGAGHTLALRTLASAALTPTWHGAAPVPQADAIEFNALLRMAWLASSVAGLALLAAGCWQLRRIRQGWRSELVCGAHVLVSANAGPAAVGILRPAIVVPAWLLQAPARQQTLVIAHEQAHLVARDPQLLALAMLLLVTMPWNLPMWWQLRRLRLAIEVDCDARVLAAGHSLKSYGAALIDIGARRSNLGAHMGALAASGSMLERRIVLMVRPPVRLLRRCAPLLAGLSLTMLAVAAQVGPPDFGPRAVVLPKAAMAAVEGYYQLGEREILVVSQSGNGLVAQINRQPSFVLQAASAEDFFVAGVDVRLQVKQRAADGHASALVLLQSGVPMRAPRVDSAAVQAVDEAIARRVAAQQAAPGSEAILRRNLALAQEGKIAEADFTPGFARLVKAGMDRMRADLHGLGKVQSLRFRGVNVFGYDRYEVRYEHGAVEWDLTLDATGHVNSGTYFPLKAGPGA